MPRGHPPRVPPLSVLVAVWLSAVPGGGKEAGEEATGTTKKGKQSVFFFINISAIGNKRSLKGRISTFCVCLVFSLYIRCL